MSPSPSLGSITQGAIPARAGVGLKPEHYTDIVDHWPAVGWFEIHAENYMEAGGPPHHFLRRIRERYPLSVHGVGMSVGGAAPLDRNHLDRLRSLCERYEPALVSEHLAWTAHQGRFFNDLLPIPYNSNSLKLVCDHIDTIQGHLKRQILVENPSTYIAFDATTMTEAEFLAEVVRISGCGLLLDVNNVFVAATNHGICPHDYIERLPAACIGELHLGGHHEDRDDTGNVLLIDSHGCPVDDEVWELFDHALAHVGARPTLIEWDNDVPAWATLRAEAERANSHLAQARSRFDVAY